MKLFWFILRTLFQPALGNFAVPALWQYTDFISKDYAASIPIELVQYRPEDVVDRVLVEVVGNVVITGASPGTTTGQPNPHALMTNAVLNTQPSYKSIVPFNNISARSLITDAAFADGAFYDPQPAIPDVAGTYAVDFFFQLIFKRPRVRKGIQWSLYLAKYTSALLTMKFSQDQTPLFTGSGNTWNFSGLKVHFWVDSDLGVQPDLIHASEVFEQTYVVNAAQADFPIDTLPPGFIYTDICFQTEVDGALSQALLNNIQIYSGAREWLKAGENNAHTIQRFVSQLEMNDQLQDLTGLYYLPLRDGMFTRGIDALRDPLTIRLNVNKPGTTNIVRLMLRRMVPEGVMPKAKAMKK